MKAPDEEVNHALFELATEMGIATEDMAAFIDTMNAIAAEATSSPKKELMWRLNARMMGEDPGEPINWRGERGLLGLFS